MLRLVAADMDGTLLDSDKRLAPGFLPLLDALLRQGVTFVVASGRQYFNLLRFFPGFEERLWFVCDNGVIVYHGTRLRRVTPLAPEAVDAAGEVIACLPTAEPIYCGAACAYLTPRPAAHESDARNFYERCRLTASPVQDARAAADPICKIAVYDPEDAAGRVYPALKTHPAGLTSVLSGRNWVDLMPPGASKGTALRAIQAELGIGPEACAAFGDYENDLPLLGACAESYAMANARPAVRAAARHQTLSNDEDGVGTALRRLFPGLPRPCHA